MGRWGAEWGLTGSAGGAPPPPIDVCPASMGGGVSTPADTMGAFDLPHAPHRVAPGARLAPHRGHVIWDVTYYRAIRDMGESPNCQPDGVIRRATGIRPFRC